MIRGSALSGTTDQLSAIANAGAGTDAATRVAAIERRHRDFLAELGLDADAVLDGHRDIDRVAHGPHAVRHQRRLGHQAGAERAALHPLAGAAAVEVDLVIAPLLAQLRGKGQVRAAGKIVRAQLHLAFGLCDAAQLMAQHHMDTGVTRQTVTQQRLELRLVEVVAVGAAMRAQSRCAAPNEQGFALRIDEVHAFEPGPGNGQHRIAQADALEDPHHFAVKMDGTRQCMDARFLLQHQYRQARDAEQVGQYRTGRSEADDGHVVNGGCAHFPPSRWSSCIRRATPDCHCSRPMKFG